MIVLNLEVKEMSGKPTEHGRKVISTTSLSRDDKLKKVQRKKKEWQNFMIFNGTASVMDSESVELAKQIAPRDGKLSEFICHISDDVKQATLRITLSGNLGGTSHTYPVKTGQNFIEEVIDVKKGTLMIASLEFNQKVTVLDCGFSSILKVKQ